MGIRRRREKGRRRGKRKSNKENFNIITTLRRSFI